MNKQNEGEIHENPNQKAKALRYRGLLDDIFERKVLSEDFSLYLHRPTATDPSLAPDGCDAFYVLSPVPHLQSGVDWRHEAETYRQAIAKHLSGISGQKMLVWVSMGFPDNEPDEPPAGGEGEEGVVVRVRMVHTATQGTNVGRASHDCA